MRILIISCMYPPQANPRAFRWGAIAERWAEQGHHIDVVCGGSGPAGMGRLRVHRVGVGVASLLRERLIRAKNIPSGTDHDAQAPSPVRRFASAAKWVHDRTWKQVFWPDFACLWYFPARRRCLELLRAEPYDAFVSVSNPYTGHLVGLSVRRRRPALRWLADIGDPFSFFDGAPPNNPRLYSRLNRRAESAVLSGADTLTFTVDAAVDAYSHRFPAFRDKMRVVPPLLSLPDSSRPSVAHGPSLAGRRLVYIGTLYKAIRSPRPLLEVFRRLTEDERFTDLHLDFYGNAEECRDTFAAFPELIGRRVHLHGPQPREVVSQRMHESHALVNIGNTLAAALPSKLVEYVSTGRPILNFASQRQDTSARFLSGYPGAVTVYGGSVGEDDLRRVAEFLSTPPAASKATVDALVGPHRIERVAEAYERELLGEGGADRVPSLPFPSAA